MKNSKTPIKMTTVSVDAATRDRVNQEAERLGLSQRQMVARMVEAYDLTQKNDEGRPNLEAKDIFDALDKVLKRDDRVVAFIKEQEKVLLKPILLSAQFTEARINQLINILSNLE